MINFKKLNRTQIAAMLIAAICVLEAGYVIFAPVKIITADEKVTVRIAEGAGLVEISQNLKSAGLIRSKYMFLLYVLAVGEEKNIKAGRYAFPQPITMPTIVCMLSGGLSEPEDISVFIPEGFNIWEIDSRLTELGFTKEGEFAKDYYREEGYLFPNTYSVKAENAIYASKDQLPENSENTVIDSMKKQMVREEIKDKMALNFDEQTEELLKNLSATKRREVIIIASILEKEARTEADMKLVAGIIYKRLAKKMPLQIDATVSYGACLREAVSSNFKKDCDVSLIGVAKEIGINSTYNTYARLGLPAGPISNPGLKAIEAAINYTSSPYLYYLTPRGTNQIIYSKTAGEHLANRRKYLGI